MAEDPPRQRSRGLGARERRRQALIRRYYFLPALALFSIPFLLQAGWREHALGEANVYSVGICALTLEFAGLSGVSLWDAVRRQRSILCRLFAVAFGLAAGMATLFLAYHGLIGIRLWRW